MKQQLSEKSQLLGRFFVYVVVIYLYSQIFESVHAPLTQFAYLAMTEVIILSTELVSFKISDDIGNGQFAYFLIRPIQYCMYRLAETSGISFVRYFFLVLVYLAIFHDSITAQSLYGFILGIGGIFLYTLLSILIGLSSFWIKDIKSIVYLNLTMATCFGGLIVSLDEYPPFMQSIAFFTPYPWILWWPAKHTLGIPIELKTAILAFGMWILWAIVLGISIFIIYKKCLKSFVLEGG